MRSDTKLHMDTIIEFNVSFVIVFSCDSMKIGFDRCYSQRPTAGVTGAGVGVDSDGEQKKLEARKCLKMWQNPQRPVHPVLGNLEPIKAKICQFDKAVLYHYGCITLCEAKKQNVYFNLKSSCLMQKHRLRMLYLI